MPTVGTDCDFTLLNTNVNGGVAVGFYFKIEGETSKKPRKLFKIGRPRLRERAYTSSGAQGYSDLGPGKYEWEMTVLARESMVNYNGSAYGLTPTQVRTHLV